MGQKHVSVCTEQLAGEKTLCSPDYLLCVIRRGRARLETPQGAIEGSAGDAVVLQPDVEYTLDGQAELICAGFSQDTLYASFLPVLEGSQLLMSFFVHDTAGADMTYLHFVGGDSVIAQAETMLEEYALGDALSDSLLQCALMRLLLHLTRSCMMNAATARTPNSHIQQQLMAYIIRHYDTVTLESLAGAFNYHPNTVAKMLRSETGMNYTELVGQVRLSNAARLLCEEGKTAQEAARLCGYQNMSNFYARFRQRYGMTPGEYARRQRGNAVKGL